MRPVVSIVMSIAYGFSTLVAGASSTNIPAQASAVSGPSASTPDAPCQINPVSLPAGWPGPAGQPHLPRPSR